MLSSFPSNLEVSQGSIQSRKEWKDREIVVDALMHLMPCSGPIYYSNESKICVPKGAKFVHGDLDLLIGEMTAECSPSFQVSIDDNQIFDIYRPELSETK